MINLAFFVILSFWLKLANGFSQSDTLLFANREDVVTFRVAGFTDIHQHCTGGSMTPSFFGSLVYCRKYCRYSPDCVGISAFMLNGAWCMPKNASCTLLPDYNNRWSFLVKGGIDGFVTLNTPAPPTPPRPVNTPAPPPPPPRPQPISTAAPAPPQTPPSPGSSQPPAQRPSTSLPVATAVLTTSSQTKVTSLLSTVAVETTVPPTFFSVTTTLDPNVDDNQFGTCEDEYELEDCESFVTDGNGGNGGDGGGNGGDGGDGGDSYYGNDGDTYYTDNYGSYYGGTGSYYGGGGSYY